MFKDRKSIVTITIVILIYIGLIELLLYFENFDKSSDLNTFLEGIWYTTVTIAGVGYGDYVPVTPFGKVVGYLFVLASIGFYGYFVSKLTNYLQELKENKKMGFYGTKFEDHTVILGWDSFSRSVADLLVKVGQRVAIVTVKKSEIDLINEHFHKNINRVFVLYSEFDNYDLLKKANIEKCRMIFINGQDDALNLVHLLNLKKEYPDQRYIVPLEKGDLKATFVSAGVTHPVCKQDLSAKLLASYIFEPEVAELGEELLTYAQDDEEHDIKEYKVISGNPLIGKYYNDAFFELKTGYNTILLGISKYINEKERKLYKNPEENLLIQEEDYLLLICNGKHESRINELFGTMEGV